MAVHVIDTIKPKNNLNFPVVEAEDVKVSDTLRLDEALENNASDITELATTVSDKANTSDVNTAVANLQGQIDQIAQAAGTGSADTEVAQARVDAEGTVYNSLKARLDSQYNVLDSASKKQVAEVFDTNNLLLQAEFHENKRYQTQPALQDIYSYFIISVIESKTYNFGSIARFVSNGTSVEAENVTSFTADYTGDMYVTFYNSNRNKWAACTSEFDISKVGTFDKPVANNSLLANVNSEISRNRTNIDNVTEYCKYLNIAPEYISNTGINKNTGATFTDSSYVASDYIEIEEYGLYQIHSACGDDGSGYAFYTENKEFISGGGLYSEGAIVRAFEVTSPQNAKYVRYTCLASRIEGTYIESSGLSKTIDNRVEGILQEYEVPEMPTAIENLSDYTCYINLTPDYIDNTFINKNNGTTGESSGYVATDYIDIIENAMYIINSACGNDAGGYAFYDINKDFISGGGLYSEGAIVRAFETAAPEGARYIRYTCLKTRQEGSGIKSDKLTETIDLHINSALSDFDFEGINGKIENLNTYTDYQNFKPEFIENTGISRTSGNAFEASNYVATDFIEVEEYGAYNIYSLCGNDASGYAFYRADHTYIWGSGGSLYSEGATVKQFKVKAPHKARYVRFSCLKARKDNSHFESGNLTESVHGYIAGTIEEDNVQICWNSDVKPPYWVFLLDTARKYFTIANLKSLIDKISEAGFNQLMLHLSTDAAFRFELSDMKFTIGQNTYDLSECLGGLVGTDSPNLWYSQSDMDEIIAYCHTKNIDLVPLFDMPGHMGKILSVFTQFRYPGTTNLLNIKDADAIAFGKAIADRFSKYFSSRGCHHYNMGYDELPNLNADPDTNGFQDLYNAGEYSYVTDFGNGISDIIKANGLIPRIFNEAVYFSNDYKNQFSKDFEVMHWFAQASKGNASAQALQNYNYKLINTSYFLYWILGNEEGSTTVEYINSINLLKDFYGGAIAHNAYGAALCAWCDGAATIDTGDGGTGVVSAVTPLIEAFGNAIQRVVDV